MRFCPRCASPLAERGIAGRVRRSCPDEACGYVFWDNPLPVLAGLVERDGLIVLARNHAWPEKLRPWDFGTGLAIRDWLARRVS